MHDTAKTLKNSIYMLTVNSSVIIIVAYGTFWLKHYNYYLTDPQDFSGSYFTETLLFFPYHDIRCNVSGICFICRRFNVNLERSFIERVCIFCTNFNYNSLKIYL